MFYQYCNLYYIFYIITYFILLHFAGFHFDITSETVSKSTEFCLNRCFQKYEEGLSKISDQKKVALWTLYLDFLVDLQQENNVANVLKKNTLLTALESASKQISLEEKYFIVWARLTTEEAETVKVIEKGEGFF